MTLRFAPLIRVSTEKQAQKGESLRTQTSQIQQHVKTLNGIIPDSCWEYSGQEHATPEHERAKLKQLLKDSSRGIFDAVMVCDISRWSRDNLQSKQGLEVLKNNGIRFFVGTTEYKLKNPEHSFILGMSAEVGELLARQQALKSITNRIERAKRGLPTAGKLPYGRTFDKRTETWGLDPEKHKNIQWAAEQYLNGMSIVNIAQVLEMNFSNLWKILTQRSGPKWECCFRNEKINVDETVIIQVPPLLDQKTIKAIKKQGDANRTYKHGEIKYRYLLSRMIFCKHCGYALSAQTNKSGRQYFRHPRHRKHECSVKNWVPAVEIGDAVLALVFEMFGDVERIEAAIKRATPDLLEIEKLREEKESAEKKHAKAIKERDRLVKSFAKGFLTEEEITSQIEPIRTRIQTIQERINVIETQLTNLPNPEQIKKKSQLARSVMVNALKNPSRKKIKKILEAPYETKRAIIERAFAGKDLQGNRLGVYVEQTDSAKRPWRFEIRAVLDQVVEFFADDSIKSSFPSYSPAPDPHGCRFPADTGSLPA